MAILKKKEKIEPSEEVKPIKEVILPKTELEAMLEQQKVLLDLRGLMTNLGIDSISKLDAVLSRVNQRVKELS